MGVSGSGKTTLGTLLAKRTGATFADADDYHSAANKAKMASGPERLVKRDHEYMTGKLLESQLSTLEPPKGAIWVVNDRPPDAVVDEILGKLQTRSVHGTQAV